MKDNRINQTLCLFLSVLMVASMVLSACAPMTPTQVPKATEVVTQVPVATEVVTQVPVTTEAATHPCPAGPMQTVELQVSVAYAPFGEGDEFNNLLNSALNDAANAISSDDQVISTNLGDPRISMASMGEPNCIGIGIEEIKNFDLYLLDSSSTLIALESPAFKFVPIPDKLGETISDQPFGSIENSFVSGENMIGLPAAIEPIVLIYNPDKLGVLEEPVTVDTIDKISDFYPLWIPPHGGIGIASFQSIIGADFSPIVLLDPNIYFMLTDYEEAFINVRETGGLKGADTDTILRTFESGDIAWTIHSTAFLRLLARDKYEGNVRIAQFPQFNTTKGGSAMGWGWIVPDTSCYPDQAWALAANLSKDPDMVRWFLYSGMLPTSPQGFNLLRDNPDLAQGLLPNSMLKNSELKLTFDQLEQAASISQAWQIPSEVPIKFYNDVFLLEADKKIMEMASGDITFKEGIDWLVTQIATMDQYK